MRLAEQALANGRGWEMFKRLVKAQGGDVRYIENPALLPAARLVEAVPAPRSGYLSGINARIVGQAVVLLGGGRSKKGDPVDYAVGVVIHHKVGDRVAAGEPLFTILANDPARLEEARASLLEAHTWSDQPVQRSAAGQRRQRVGHVAAGRAGHERTTGGPAPTVGAGRDSPQRRARFAPGHRPRQGVWGRGQDAGAAVPP